MQNRFRGDVLRNYNNRTILERWEALALPDGWLVAGCLFQTVWNLQAGRAPETDIKDNPLTPYLDLFEAKAASYRGRWPWLRIMSTISEKG